MKQLKKNLITVSVILTLLVSASGCSFTNNASKSKNDNDTKQSSQNSKSGGESDLKQDTKKTEQLKKEKEILNGQVYIRNNMVTVTMVIKDNVSEADAKALADKYAKELKKSYKDMKVNVQAVQKGKNIADITIEK